MNLNLVNEIGIDQLRTDIPEFRPGRMSVDVKIKEGDKSVSRTFEGLVIAKKGAGTLETFTVRKMSSGVGVERTFPPIRRSSTRSRSYVGAKSEEASCSICAVCPAAAR